MKKITLQVILVAFICVPANLFSQKKTIQQKFNYKQNPALSGVQADEIKSVDSLLQSFVDNKKLNCVTAFVAKGGNVIYKKSFGLKDVHLSRIISLF